jgi:hypothetical protein
VSIYKKELHVTKGLSNMITKKYIILFIGILTCLTLTSTNLFSQDPANPAETTQNGKKDLPSELGGWRVTDFQPYVKAFKELEKVNKEYSIQILTQAIDNYAKGLDILQDMENEVEKTKSRFKLRSNLNERWYWQEIDRRNQEERKISYIKFEAKMKSITSLTKAINLLDEIRSTEVRKDQKFINFQIRLFQVYVSTQYDLHNLKPCIPILERYVTITNKTKNDVWAYKYLASCYGFMEATLKKYRHSSEDVIIEFKQKKNRALLRAAELYYGIDTPHYKHLKEVVELDERKSEKLNDFK